MTTFNQQKMYNSLVSLCDEDPEKKFIYKDFDADEQHIYRIFGYQIPKYMDYQKPYAKECRGSMFLVRKDTMEMVELLALPMPKFFTFEENPETSKVDFSKIKRAFLKPDGSLISSYLDINKTLKFKTKKVPEQDIFNEIIDSVMYPEFKSEIEKLTQTHTIDFELTSPLNRVILSYEKAELHVLKARSRFDGEFLDIYSQNFKALYPEIAKHLVKPMDVELMRELGAKNRNLDIQGIEGLVIEMENGQMMKVKTTYYLSQNRFANIQDFKKYDQLLVEACIEETFDELRTLFHYRNRSENYRIDEILSRMEQIEDQVVATFNPFVEKIETFFEKHKDLDMKEYQKAISEQDLKGDMNILMPMYKGVNVNLKTHYMNSIGKNLKSTKSD